MIILPEELSKGGNLDSWKLFRRKASESEIEYLKSLVEKSNMDKVVKEVLFGRIRQLSYQRNFPPLPDWVHLEVRKSNLRKFQKDLLLNKLGS